MNQWLFEQFNAFARATPWLHAPAQAFAAYGVVLFAVLLLAGWWIARRAGRVAGVVAAISAGGATLLAVAVNQPIVQAVHEARPYTSLPGILVLANRSTDPSFPSDHATMAGAVAAGVWIVNRRLGIAAVGTWLLVRRTLTWLVELVAGTCTRAVLLS